MGVILDVPYCNQLRFPNGCSPLNDPTGCWYASACMVGWFFEAGPRQGVPELHSSRLPAEIRNRLGFQGHFATGSANARQVMQAYAGGQSEHVLLAQREHLAAVEDCATTHNYTADELERYLRRYGPIFFYWTKTNAEGQTYGHASVLCGVRELCPELTFHDPENAPNSLLTLDDFNTKRQHWQYALMRRDGTGNTVPAHDS
ncbi:MAG: papain-like cysteine protease family protein [Gemmataceae bacterium]